MDTDIKCWPGPKNNDKFNTSFTEGSGKLVTGSANDQQNSDLWDSALLAGLFIGSNLTISKRYLETLKSMQTVDAEGTEASIDAVLTSLLYCSAEDNGENLADEKDELLPVTSGFVSEDRRVDTELDLKDYELGNDSENIVMEKTMLNSELFDSRPSLSVLDTSDLLKAGEKAIMLDPVLPELKLRGLPNVFPSPIMASVLPYMTQNPPKNSISTGSHHNNTFVEPLSYANKDENEKNSEKNLASGSKNPSERSKATMDFSALVYQDLSEGFSNVLANSVGYSNDDGTKNMQYEKQLNQGLVSYDIHSDESFNRGFSDNLNVAHFKKVLSSGFADVNTMLMNKDANVTAVHFDENNSSVKANSRSNVVNGNSKSSSQSAVGTQLYSLSQGNALVESSSSDEDDDQSFDIHDRDYYNSSNKADHVFSYLKI
ncbi:hypothetical protein AX774_g1083 [Zancudomyces culisetae]|uniref:Uncharacterized protein n=1 Tax=Zancudomyces culisetae TaxID=1213189 RepID=A0A1R1PIY8_ZANCU|nr:hypothetical protein AX774_g5638 [Zancudomyces culisetae]OMH85375.1 hypothetical protein AX774_g1083 [Zancudomyces culisetae]|eukprot:OMH80917.1 hypothetical protein AX774_g5638 [Zancudomyces culisetae]